MVEPSHSLPLETTLPFQADAQDSRDLLAAVGVFEAEPGAKHEYLGLLRRERGQASSELRDEAAKLGLRE